MLAQVLGAMTAAAVVYGNYKSAIDEFEGGAGIRTVPGYSENATAGVFCTYPANFMSNTGQFFSEFVASALLMFLIYAIKDDHNIGAKKVGRQPHELCGESTDSLPADSLGSLLHYFRHRSLLRLGDRIRH